MALKIGSLLKNLRKPEGLVKNPVSKSISKATGINQSFGGIKGVNDARAAMNQARSAVVSHKPTPIKTKNLNQNDKNKSQIKPDSLEINRQLQRKDLQGVYDPRTNTLINTGTDITTGGSKEPEKEVEDHEQEKAKKPGRLKEALREVVYGLSLLPGPLQGIGAKIVDARKKEKERLEDNALTEAQNEASKSSSSESGYGPNSKLIPAVRKNTKISQSGGKRSLNKQQKRKLNIKKKTNIRKQQVT